MRITGGGSKNTGRDGGMRITGGWSKNRGRDEDTYRVEQNIWIGEGG